MSEAPTPNVLLLVDQSGSRWSSQEDFCAAIARDLRSRGGGCVLAYSSPPAPAVETAFREAGADVEVASVVGSSLVAFCRYVRELCKRHHIGVVHLRHYPPSGRVPAALSLALPCPTIMTDDTSGKVRPKRLIKGIAFRAFNRLMNAGVAHIVAPSRFVEQRLVHAKGIPARKVIHISNAIDLVRFRRGDPARIREELRLADGQLLVLAAANLIPEKGTDVLLRSFALVAGPHPNAVLAIAGDGPERGNLEALARELGVSDSVLFLGQRSDMPDLLAATAVCCCPSIWAEAFCWVNAEAMACQVPVVAARSGAIPEVVAHGETGLLVPLGDPDAMAAAISELLASPDRRRQMGRAGRQRAEKLFDLRRTVSEHIALYERIAEDR